MMNPWEPGIIRSAAKRSFGRGRHDVAVAHGGHRGHRPPEAEPDRGEVFAVDEPHDHAEDDDECRDARDDEPEDAARLERALDSPLGKAHYPARHGAQLSSEAGRWPVQREI